MRYGIVGDGSLSCHLYHYLSELCDESVTVWSRKNNPHQKPAEVLTSCDVIWVLISDGAIEPFLREHKASLPKATWVHASGALNTELATAAHPLMSFTAGTTYSPETYRSIPFVMDAEAPPFRDLFPKLPNPHYRIPKENRAVYHALCVLAGNGTALLWREVLRRAQTALNLPPQAFHPYLKQIQENVAQNAEAALTGPWKRRDFQTVQKNLEAIKGDALEPLYRVLCGLEYPQ